MKRQWKFEERQWKFEERQWKFEERQCRTADLAAGARRDARLGVGDDSVVEADRALVDAVRARRVHPGRSRLPKTHDLL